MGSLAFNSAGLGISDLQAQAVSCYQLGKVGYLLDPYCWGKSFADWQTEYYGKPSIPASVVAAPTAPANLINPGAEYEAEGADAGVAAAQAVQDQITAATVQTQQNISDFFAGISPPPEGSCAWLGISCLTWAMIGGVLFLVAGVFGVAESGVGGPHIYKQNRARRGRR